MYWKKLKRVNKEAAKYLDTLSPMEKKKIFYTGDEPGEACKVLPELFRYDKTPQGRAFWQDVNLDCSVL